MPASKSRSSIPFRSSLGIPRKVMQTWKTGNVPDHWKTSPESFQKLMPDWDYTLMTDSDNRQFVADHFPDFLETYDRFEYPIQRADAIRYCWLYVHGGIYCDLDLEVLRPLDDLFTSNAEVYLVASGNLGSFITNSFMASKPGAQLWLDVIDEMKKPASKWWIGKHWKVMNTTGPLMLDRVAKRSPTGYAALPATSLMPCSVCDSICIPLDAHLRPLPGQSWCGWDSKIYNLLLCQWRSILQFIIILGILILSYFIGRSIYRKFSLRSTAN